MRTVDLFCGCGGMSLGFQIAGFDIIAAYDNWQPAVNTYKKNFTHDIFLRDLSDHSMVDEIKEKKPSIIIGGPPCQDFSSAGYRDETLGRATLSKTYTDIVTSAKPTYFVMENVPRIRMSETYKYVYSAMKDAGYGLTEKIIDASYCGVPQKRKRFFLIGCLGADDGFLNELLDQDLSDRPMTIHDYLGDSLGVEYYFRIPRSYSRRAVFSIYEPCQTIRGVDRPIPPNYKKHPQDPVEIGPLVRALTPKERSYMQTFPEEFIFEENRTNTNQMIGNAVPVKLAEYVAKAILKYEERRRKMGNLDTVDLFCGCGGMSLGFQNAGYKISAAYDNWKAAVRIYDKNFDHPIYQMDLNDSESTELIINAKPEIIIGGPPCQDFSIAGNRNMGERANLTIRFAQIISKVRPEWFVMENVYNIERMPVLPQAVQIVKDAGYGITTRVLDASRCGVPQKRNRFFMIGHLNDQDGFLNEIIDANLSESQMTVYDYLGDSLGTEFYYMHPRSYNRRAVFSIHEPSATIRGVNRPIPDGYKKHHADKAEISEGVRSLTSKERSYIQTFPEEFVFEGSKTEVEQAIGNAVPVKLAEFVARCLKEYMNKE